MSTRRGALREYVNFTNFAFWIKYHFNIGIWFTILLSYRAIRVFLVQKFSYPVATHGHEPSQIRGT
jgi:hypothetical protein